MKIVYITSYSFPSKKAEPYYARSLAQALTAHIGNDLLFVMNGDIPSELEHIQTVSIQRRKKFRAVYYFFWFLNFIFKRKLYGSDVIFISNDPFLLLIFIFWRKILRRSYKICADWHLLFDDWKDSIIIQNADYVITTTQRLKDITVLKCGITPDKVLVAYGGVDENIFLKKERVEKNALRKQLELPVGTFLVGYIGTFRGLDFEKGITTMLKALVHLPEQMHMAFVGGTQSQILEYRALAEEMGITDRCIFFEKQPLERVILYESAMDILVIPYPDHPHFRDYGFPIKVWEYMASGRPIVYSNLEVIDEVLHGRGVSCIPDDAEDLAKKICEIHDNFNDAEYRAKKNMTDIMLYTWDKKAEKILNFFKST